MMKLQKYPWYRFAYFFYSNTFSEYYLEHFGEYRCLIIIVSISSSSALDITMNTTPEIALSIFLFVNIEAFKKIWK